MRRGAVRPSEARKEASHPRESRPAMSLLCEMTSGEGAAGGYCRRTQREVTAGQLRASRIRQTGFRSSIRRRRWGEPGAPMPQVPVFVSSSRSAKLSIRCRLLNSSNHSIPIVRSTDRAASTAAVRSLPSGRMNSPVSGMNRRRVRYRRADPARRMLPSRPSRILTLPPLLSAFVIT